MAPSVRRSLCPLYDWESLDSSPRPTPEGASHSRPADRRRRDRRERHGPATGPRAQPPRKARGGGPLVDALKGQRPPLPAGRHQLLVQPLEREVGPPPAPVVAIGTGRQPAHKVLRAATAGVPATHGLIMLQRGSVHHPPSERGSAPVRAPRGAAPSGRADRHRWRNIAHGATSGSDTKGDAPWIHTEVVLPGLPTAATLGRTTKPSEPAERSEGVQYHEDDDRLASTYRS